MIIPDLDVLIDDYRTRYQIPGLSVGVASRGILLHAAGYGFANLEHDASAAADTIYQTASVGKQFTAALILLLAEHGAVNVDELIVSHFSPAPAAWTGITFRHLLTHRCV